MAKKINLTMEAQGVDMSVNREEMALAVKQWRLRNDFTQRETAARWGISRESIIRIEKGKEVTWQLAYKVFAKLAKELRNEGIAQVEED